MSSEDPLNPGAESTADKQPPDSAAGEVGTPPTGASGAAEGANPSPEGGSAPATMPDGLAQEEEQKIRRELGIGSHGKVTIDASTVEKLLEDALVGYEQVFAGTEFEPQPAEGDETRAAPPRPVGPALNVEDLLGKNLDLLKDVHMKVKVELGRGRMYLKDILRLDQGSVVELERLAGDPLEIYVNNKVIARGEVLVLNENFCIRITEIVNPAELLSQG